MGVTTMKRILISALALGLFAAPATLLAAERGYGLAGCGLGSILMGPRGSQTSASTTNGTFYSQLFGLTSGTSNCMPDAQASAALNVARFVAANRVALADDIARGNGETLASLSGILQCSDNQAVHRHLQANFSTIFPSARVNPLDVTDAILDSIESNPAVAATCSLI